MQPNMLGRGPTKDHAQNTLQWRVAGQRARTCAMCPNNLGFLGNGHVAQAIPSDGSAINIGAPPLAATTCDVLRWNV